MPLYCFSALLGRNMPSGPVAKPSVGYVLRNNEDEARGAYVDAIMREHHDYYLRDLVCIEIPTNTMRAALGLDPVED